MMYIKVILAAALALLAAISTAQAQPVATAPIIADVPKGLVQALQYVRSKKPSGQWTRDDVLPIRVAITKDGVVEPSEQAVLDQLKTERFDFIVRGRQEATFKPKDFQLTGALAREGVAVLTIAASDLAAATTQQPNESRAAFLMRVREAGAAELATLVATDAAARAEARALLAASFDADYTKALREFGLQPAYSLARQAASARLGFGDNLPSQQKAAWRSLLAEAAVVANRKHDISLECFAMLFSSPQAAQTEAAAIAGQLGLKEYGAN
jgi:uncharacterized protein (DUF924 family)